MSYDVHIAALQRELRHAQKSKAGGQPPDPGRVAAIRDQIRIYERMSRPDVVETADVVEPVETADLPVKRGPGRPRKNPETAPNHEPWGE